MFQIKQYIYIYIEYKKSTHHFKKPGFCDVKEWEQDEYFQNFKVT